MVMNKGRQAAQVSDCSITIIIYLMSWRSADRANHTPLCAQKTQAEYFDAWVRFKAEGIPLPSHIQLRRPKCCWDVDMTCYTNLELWLSHYPGQLLMIPSAELKSDKTKRAVFKEVLDFVGACHKAGCWRLTYMYIYAHFILPSSWSQLSPPYC